MRMSFIDTEKVIGLEDVNVSMISGCEDFELLVSLGWEENDWTLFEAFYSPSARRYFWYQDNGCSCNTPYDDVSSSADFQNGDYARLVKTVKNLVSDGFVNNAPMNKALETLRKKNLELKKQG